MFKYLFTSSLFVGGQIPPVVVMCFIMALLLGSLLPSIFQVCHNTSVQYSRGCKQLCFPVLSWWRNLCVDSIS